MPEPELPRLQTRLAAEVLVEQLRRDHRGGRVVAVGGSEGGGGGGGMGGDRLGRKGARGRDEALLARADHDPARARIARENRWSMKVRSGLMSRTKSPCMQSLRIMSSRSSPARVAISGMHNPDA